MKSKLIQIEMIEIEGDNNQDESDSTSTLV